MQTMLVGVYLLYKKVQIMLNMLPFAFYSQCLDLRDNNLLEIIYLSDEKTLHIQSGVHLQPSCLSQRKHFLMKV